MTVLLLIDATKKIVHTHAKGIGKLSEVFKGRRPLTGLEVRNRGGLQALTCLAGFTGEIKLA